MWGLNNAGVMQERNREKVILKRLGKQPIADGLLNLRITGINRVRQDSQVRSAESPDNTSHLRLQVTLSLLEKFYAPSLC